MAGIRVRSVPKNGKEKHLKIHFSKPEHGGGKIKKIYFPLFNNDAVILYEDPKGDILLFDLLVNTFFCIICDTSSLNLD